ncbi:MAG TPA: hypothetical protein VGU72_09710 [Beijerinckiaceae bacterium]|jgi:hypothetical protein|nr:hypothetical protein [Beijerinckiaceae bacterium]
MPKTVAATAIGLPTDIWQTPFRELEDMIANLHDMSALLECVFEDTINSPDPNVVEEHIRKEMEATLSGYTVHVLSDDQYRALNYALTHMVALAEELHCRYHASWPTSGRPK